MLPHPELLGVIPQLLTEQISVISGQRMSQR